VQPEKQNRKGFPVIYAAFTFWLFLIAFMGMGIYRLWAGLVKPAWINWALLPGTAVSEMAYIFGCLITGGEIKRAKLIDTSAGKTSSATGTSDAAAGASGTVAQAAPKLKFIGPAVASLLAIVACAAAIIALHTYLGRPVISQFNAALSVNPTIALPAVLPGTWEGFWDQIVGQVRLLQRSCQAWAGLQWSDWHVPLFVYLAACLSIRLAPARREVRAMLFSLVLIAVGIAIAGQLNQQFETLMSDLWPLLTYVWASLLLLLTTTLLIRAIASLVMTLAGKTAGKAGK
jgi:hypothetical protein